MSLYERSYMKDAYHGGSDRSALKVLLIVIGVCFVIQHLAPNLFRVNYFDEWLRLSWSNLSGGLVHTLVTYAFLHVGLFHIAINCLILFFAGRWLQETLSDKDMYKLFFFCVLVGAAFFLLINRHGNAEGASAAVLGFLTMVLLQKYNERITLLLFFIIPFSQTGKVFLLILGGFELLGLVLFELPNKGNIGHSAHLGGMVAGLLFYRWKYGTLPWKTTGYYSPEPSKKKKQWFKPEKYSVNILSRGEKKKEVDRILEKISQEGMGSLTAEERKTLDEAPELFNR